MKKNKIIISTLIIIFILIMAPTIYKIYQNHNKNLIKVVEEEFMYYAKICYKKEKCNTKVYLNDLYNNNYLTTKLTNPLTKEYYSDTSYIDLETKEIKLVS